MIGDRAAALGAARQLTDFGQGSDRLPNRESGYFMVLTLEPRTCGLAGHVTLLSRMDRKAEIRRKCQVGSTLSEREARLWAAASNGA